MNDLCAEIGYQSLIKDKEQLCGDHIEVIKQLPNSTVIVLADGLGSGVKANILSILTSKIISTMLAESLSIEDCISTVAATLPVCAERNVAYSTFTILQIIDQKEAEIIQYDNPQVILLRKGKNFEYPKTILEIENKKIYKSRITIEKDDIFILLSDGAIYAGVGMNLNFGWERKDIISFMETFYEVGFTAKTLATVLLEQCNKLYENKPGDDTSVCVVRIRKRTPLNLIFGPPSNPNDLEKMMSLFFAKEGKHVVCGGTTSTLAAKYLNKPLIPSMKFIDPEIPPTAHIDGVDLVTEGVVTMSKVLSYAKDYLKDNAAYTRWGYSKDGASQLARILFEDATDINFFVGHAINPAHQNPNLPIQFNIKMQIINDLAKCLKKMGKNIIISAF